MVIKKPDDEDEIDLKKAVREAKQKPLNFAMSTSRSGFLFSSHKLKDYETLAMKLKKTPGCEAQNMTCGQMRVDGSEVHLNTFGKKVKPQVIKAFKEMLKSQQISLKPKADEAEKD